MPTMGELGLFTVGELELFTLNEMGTLPLDEFMVLAKERLARFQSVPDETVLSDSDAKKWDSLAERVREVTTSKPAKWTGGTVKIFGAALLAEAAKDAYPHLKEYLLLLTELLKNTLENIGA